MRVCVCVCVCVCACVYIYIYTHIYIYIYTHTYICIAYSVPELNPSWQPSLKVDHRLRQTIVDTDLLLYLLEEFCRSAKAT